MRTPTHGSQFRSFPFQKGRARAAVLLLAAAGLASGCRSQVLPGPMVALADPLPPGDSRLYPSGPEEVIVVRHADPVRVRPAGLLSSYPLSFHSKSTRLNSGCGVYSSSGGRIEVIWPGAGSIVISGEGSGIVGSASRGEPTFIFRELERATLDLREGDQVELLGGSLLTASSGPFVLEHGTSELVRVRNQSKQAAQIAFRSDTIQLDPGEVVDLPLLSAGGEPSAALMDMEELDGPGFRARMRGDCEVEARDDALLLRSREAGVVHALGLRIQLEAGDRLHLGGLSSQTDEPSQVVPASSSTSPSDS